MATEVTQKFLQEHFRKHDTLTLYKPDGTPMTFCKKYEYEVCDSIFKYNFKTFDQLNTFFQKHGVSMTPVITVS